MSQFIRVVDGALDADLCRRIIERFERDAARRPGVTGSGVEPDKKLSTDLRMSDRPEWADLLRPVQEALMPHLEQYAGEFRSMVVGTLTPAIDDPRTGSRVVLDVDNFVGLGEPYVPQLLEKAYRLGQVNLQKYDRGIGGYPHWHSEIFPDVSGTSVLRRVLFWMFYLNDVEDGGETEFLYQGIKVRPRTGRLVIAPTSFTHTHRGNTPRSADKYIITSWLLFREARELFTQIASPSNSRAARNAAKRSRRERR